MSAEDDAPADSDEAPDPADTTTLTTLTLPQIEQEAHLLVMDEPEAELLRWLNLSMVLCARAKELRQQVEQVLIDRITARGPIDCGNLRYTVGHTKTVTCSDVDRCLQEVLQAVRGDLATFCQYLRSDPFKYGSVRQLLGDPLFDQLFRAEQKPKLVEGKPQKQLIRQDRRYLHRRPSAATGKEA